jgi:hypothetical protein
MRAAGVHNYGRVAGDNVTAPAALQLTQVRKAFGDTVAVSSVDLDVQPGAFFGLVGRTVARNQLRSAGWLVGGLVLGLLCAGGTLGAGRRALSAAGRAALGRRPGRPRHRHRRRLRVRRAASRRLAARQVAILQLLAEATRPA